MLTICSSHNQKDLYFVCGATNDKQFVNLVNILGKPELADDDRFSTNPRRVTNRDALSEILNELFAARTTNEWMTKFEGSGMPYGAVNSMQKVFEHPQTKARDMVVEMTHEAANTGKLSLLGKLDITCMTIASCH